MGSERAREVEYVKAAGPEQAPPVVLFHGMGLGRWVWARTQQVLAQRGISSFAYDLPGHGASLDNPSLRRAEDDVTAIVRSHAGASLVGHSIGGYFSQVAASRENVHALALVGAFPTRAVRLVPTRAQLRSSLRHVVPGLLGRPFHMRYEDYHRCGFDALPADEAQRAFTRVTPWPGRLVRRLAIDRQHVDRDAITAPVLCVIGKRDQVVRWQVGRALGEHLDALIWRYDDLGHFPMIEPAGTRFDDDLAGWLLAPRGRRIK